MTYLKITKKDDAFINVAYNEAHKSCMAMKHGACVVENNRVIGVACNTRRNRFKGNFIGVSCSCHAEMNAIINAIKHKSGYKNTQLSISRKNSNKHQLKGRCFEYLQ